jgi:hypothetical protein
LSIAVETDGKIGCRQLVVWPRCELSTGVEFIGLNLVDLQRLQSIRPLVVAPVSASRRRLLLPKCTSPPLNFLIQLPPACGIAGKLNTA